MLTSVFKGPCALEPTTDRSAINSTPLVLATALHQRTHAPPAKRYLLACTLRL